jgi:hypothetical protein
MIVEKVIDCYRKRVMWSWCYYSWQNVVWPCLTFGNEWDEFDRKEQEMYFWWMLNYGNSPERPYPRYWKEGERAKLATLKAEAAESG